MWFICAALLGASFIAILGETVARRYEAAWSRLTRRHLALTRLVLALARRPWLRRRALAGLPADIWDGEGENPYFGMLAHADYIVATCDSVNMLSEAAGTGKPVYVVDLRGGSRKFARFHESLSAAGITRPFAGRLEDWEYRPLDEARRVADEIRHRRQAD